ncbi:hypothetical protein GW17_00057165 [Ensete ventricosum]|nr:hypothetical protein GW17_00057165 [Ensete ventricosum]
MELSWSQYRTFLTHAMTGGREEESMSKLSACMGTKQESEAGGWRVAIEGVGRRTTWRTVHGLPALGVRLLTAEVAARPRIPRLKRAAVAGPPPRWCTLSDGKVVGGRGRDGNEII